MTSSSFFFFICVRKWQWNDVTSQVTRMARQGSHFSYNKRPADCHKVLRFWEYIFLGIPSGVVSSLPHPCHSWCHDDVLRNARWHHAMPLVWPGPWPPWGRARWEAGGAQPRHLPSLSSSSYLVPVGVSPSPHTYPGRSEQRSQWDKYVGDNQCDKTVVRQALFWLFEKGSSFFFIRQTPFWFLKLISLLIVGIWWLKYHKMNGNFLLSINHLSKMKSDAE